MDIIFNPKYQLFFKTLFRQKEVSELSEIFFIDKKENNDFNSIFLKKEVVLDFKAEKYKCIEIPNIRSNDNLILKNVNCDKLILNGCQLKELIIDHSKFNQLKFNCNKNSNYHFISTFRYNGRNEDNENLITIPPIIFFQTMYISNSRKKWRINNNLFKLNIKNIPFNRIKIKNKEKVTSITYKNKLSQKIELANMDNLEFIMLNVSKQTSIKLRNIPNLSKLFIKNTTINNKNNYEIESQNILNLNKINSSQLSELSILGFEIKNTPILNDPKLKYICLDNNYPGALKGKYIFMLSNDKELNFFLIPRKTKENIFNFLLQEQWILEEKNNIINEFLELRESTLLMKNVLMDNLKYIQEDDFKTIHKNDKMGLNALLYCSKLDTLKTILQNKNYVLNKDDMEKLTNKIFKSYYENEFIKQKLRTKNSLTINTNLLLDIKSKKHI